MMLAYTPGRAVGAEEACEADADAPIEDWKVLRPEERDSLPEDEWIWRWVKMSKSYGNTVTPDEAAEQYGADALRVYEMFVVPFEDTVQWSDEGIRGCVRFLGRVWRLVGQHVEGFNPQAWREAIGSVQGKDATLRRKTHQTIIKLTEDMEDFRFNTAIAALMEWVNAIYEVSNALPQGERSAAVDEAIEALVQLIAPTAPHIADEMWACLGMEGFLYKHPWPQADEAVATAVETLTIVVQVNSKVRDKLEVAPDTDMEEIKTQALKLPGVARHVEGKEIVKVVAVPGKLVNVVVK
jgi:leucyl-tRNA synthetase